MSARAPLCRADFGDAESYARAMAAHGPMSADGVDAFVGLVGEHGAVLSATWGTRAERRMELDAEMRAEARARPFLFVEKLRPRVASLSKSTVQPGSALFSEAEFSEAVSAAQFARERGWLLDMSATLAFTKMGATSDADVEEGWRRYRKRFSQLLRDWGLPVAYIGVLENGAAGLHAHVLLHMPIARRDQVVQWHLNFIQEESQSRGADWDVTAVQFSRHRKHHPLLHDMLVNYALKGFDPCAVVQSASASLDGREVRLGDLVAFAFADPGRVPFARLYVGAALAKAARGAWLSLYERGARRVDVLYGPEFVGFMRRRVQVELPPSREEALVLRACADALFAAIDLSAGLQDCAVEATVANVELVAQAVDRLVYDIGMFEMAAFGEPQRLVLETLRRSVRAAVQLVEAAGGRAVALVLAEALPPALVRSVVPALERVEERVRAVAMHLGEAATPPRWALQLTCAQLARV